MPDDFWANCDRSGGDDACWPWMRAVNRNGYGSLWLNGRSNTASRVAYELANGPIPSGPGYHGYVVMHTCDNRRCCNPRHLALGTQRDNNADRDSKGRASIRPRGEASHNARLTQDGVKEIRARLRAGESLAAVARAVGVSKSAVNHVKAGRTWRHLSDTPLGQAAVQRATY